VAPQLAALVQLGKVMPVAAASGDLLAVAAVEQEKLVILMVQEKAGMG
jgi:hypothetical protein